MIRFPTLDIVPVEGAEEAATKLHALDKVNWLIFISANAVNFALNKNNGKIDQLHAKIAAVGRATAKALHERGLKVDLMPSQGFNTEALLESPSMADIHGKHCIIVRGRGGREMLADTLRERGAKVEYLEVYQRVIPRGNNAKLLERMRQNGLDAVIVTSVEALKNLLTMLDEQASLIYRIPLVVISDRIRKVAEEVGFKRVVVSDSPADAAILQSLITIQWGKQWPK